MGKFYSDELEKGIELLYFQDDHSKFSDGIKLIEQACENGEADAYYFLARCYAWEDGDVKEDLNKAVALSRKGIELGSDLCILGIERFNELDKAKDVMKHSLKEAFETVKAVASAGEPMAQYAIGIFYYWGDMLELQEWKTKEEIRHLEAANGAESVKWFKLAARQGCIPAFANLYLSVRNGKNGVPKDLRKALSYVEEYKNDAQVRSDLYYNIGNDYEKMGNTKKQIEWYEKGIERENACCMNALGILYLDGKGVPKDYGRALELFRQGGTKNDGYSLYNLGRCNFFGWGISENKTKAFTLFEWAAEKKVGMAQYFLAKYYDEGIAGVERDFKKRYHWASKAIKNGAVSAKYYLGKSYLFGQGTETNFALALSYFQECAAGSDINRGVSYWHLGKMYEKGYGVSKNYNKAVEYYQKALENQCSSAEEELARFKKGLFGNWKLIQ